MNDKFYKIFSLLVYLGALLLLVAQVVLIVLKIFAVVALSWWLVLLPLWILLSTSFLMGLVLVWLILQYNKYFVYVDFDELQ